eukprot:5226739-Prymnesium_polylepis.1
MSSAAPPLDAMFARPDDAVDQPLPLRTRGSRALLLALTRYPNTRLIRAVEQSEDKANSLCYKARISR